MRFLGHGEMDQRVRLPAVLAELVHSATAWWLTDVCNSWSRDPVMPLGAFTGSLYTWCSAYSDTCSKYFLMKHISLTLLQSQPVS